MIKAVTLDFWGTLLHDSPAGDERYKRQRLASIERILKKAGVKVGPRQLDRADDESGHRLARIWQRRFWLGVGVSNLQAIPVLGRYCATDDALHFSNHHPKLGHGVFRIRWDCQAVLFVHHKLMPCARKGTVKAK